MPKSTAVKSVRGEQKTYVVGTRRYALNNTPLKETTQVEAIVEIVSNITRGSVGGGEDLLVPNPVVDILEVSQGATVFQEGADWQQSGNYVDWLGSGNEPAIGTTYTVRWTYTKQMIKGTDYVDGGWFGRSGHRRLTVFLSGHRSGATGETQYDRKVVWRDTPVNQPPPGFRSAGRPVTASIAARKTRSAPISSGSRTWPPGSRRTSTTA